MKQILPLVAGIFLAASAAAQDALKPPTVSKEHQWLKQLAGEWTTEVETAAVAGQPAEKWAGTESIRSIGEFWSVSEIKSGDKGATLTGHLTVGYDADKKAVVGTWICSLDSHIVHYTGNVTGQTLTLETEIAVPGANKRVKMKDVIELKEKNTKVTTSYALGDDGKWTSFMTMTSKRK